MKLTRKASGIARGALSRCLDAVAGDDAAHKILAGISRSIPGGEGRARLAREKCLEIGNRWDILQIGLTDNCNLLCRHCFRAKRYLSPKLPLWSFKYFLASFHPDCFDTLLLSDGGELFTIGNVLDYFRHAKSIGWRRLELVTNASLLSEPTIDAIMRERLLAHLIVSIEAAAPGPYEFIRGARWETFLKNLDLLVRKNKEHRAGVMFAFNVCCFRDNLKELPGIMDMAARYGMGIVRFVHLNPITYSVQAIKDPILCRLREGGLSPRDKLCFDDQHLEKEDRRRVVETFASVLEKAAAHGTQVFLPERYPELAPLRAKAPLEESAGDGACGPDSEYVCGQPMKWVQVSLLGKVFPCCQMGKAYSLGNLYRAPFHAIWGSERARQFRESLRREGTPSAVCRQCNVYRGRRF